MSKVISPKTLSVLILALLFSVVIYGFAAANTVPASNAGIGDGTITGFTVSNIAYTLDGTDPSLIASVAFDTNPGAGTVQIKLEAAGSTWFTCSDTSGGSGTSWGCTTTGATVLNADQLTVVATD